MGIQDEWRLADCEKKAREGSECANQMYSVLNEIRQICHELRACQQEIENLKHELYQSDQRFDEVNNRLELLEFPNE